MRPETHALRVLSTTRAKAKMFEFRVPLEDHIELAQNPDVLFSLAVGILGDAAAAIADEFLAPRASSAEAHTARDNLRIRGMRTTLRHETPPAAL